MPVENESQVDGRRARRERGRVAVSEAMIDLVFDGNIPPTADQIAERAGVSIASLFRYFETLDELRRETVDIYFDRYAHLFEITDVGEGTLDERVQNFVAARATLYETTEPMCRLVRMRANEVAEVSELVHLVHATRADQIRHHFDLELTPLSPAVRDDVTATISALTSFESWDLMCNHLGRTHQQVRRAWARTLLQILRPGDDARSDQRRD
jgi:AcrR family transcriptional regulator